MSKKATAGEEIGPANLWGKPLPRIPGKPGAGGSSELAAGTRSKKSDSDVDAELEEDEAGETDLESEESDEEESTVLDTSDDGEPVAEGADTADEDDDEVDSTVEADESAPRARKPRANTKVEEAMAEKKTLSDYVREEIAERKSSGESLRGVDIMNALAKRKIKVSAAQVSQLLKKEGISAKARGGRKPAAAAASEERSRVANKARTASRPASGTDLPWDRLNAAKAFVSACGGSVEEAEDVLSMFQKLNKVVTA